jgi:hypothetical protein
MTGIRSDPGGALRHACAAALQEHITAGQKQLARIKPSGNPSADRSMFLPTVILNQMRGELRDLRVGERSGADRW